MQILFSFDASKKIVFSSVIAGALLCAPTVSAQTADAQVGATGGSTVVAQVSGGSTSAPAATAGQSAPQGQVRAMYDRLRRLEETLDGLQRAVYAGTPLPAPQSLAPQPAAPSVSSAQDVGSGEAELLYDRVLGLEEETRALTGHYEVMDHKLDSLLTRLDRLVVDLDFRLRTIEDAVREAPAGAGGGNATAGAGQVQPLGGDGQIQEVAPGAVKVLGTMTQDQLDATGQPAAGGQQASLLPEGSVQERYETAFDFVRDNRFSDAEFAFDEFIAAHPNDPLASNAYYWKAESIFARKDYARAAAVFLSGYQAFPEGNKAPDMLLKLSMTLTELGVNDQACATVAQLRSSFPDVKGAIKRRADRTYDQAGCATLEAPAAE